MPFCNVKDDVLKIKAFIDENKNAIGSPSQFNEYLQSCVYMELASLIGFANVLIGYFLARSIKNAMSLLCKADAKKLNDATLSREESDELAHLKENLKLQDFKEIKHITPEYKETLCFWIQYMNNLSNAGSCPTTVSAKKHEMNNPYMNLVPGMPCWPR